MIFILGGSGFVGSAFARFCDAEGLDHEVVTRSNYARHAGRRCETLVAAHGNSSKLLGRRDPVADFERTVSAVKKSLADFGFSRYVLASSCDVYPDCSSPGATGEGSVPPAARHPYGFHKHLAEQCALHACPGALVLRLGGMVGPGLKKNPVYDILRGGPLWISPDSRLQYMHTDDVARIAMGLEGGTYNLCGSGTVRVGDLPGAEGVEVADGAPRVTYDVDVSKISAEARLPRSERAVREFMREPGV